jgi:oligopeptide/dipeptide ABC transporter ATP-binding protein
MSSTPHSPAKLIQLLETRKLCKDFPSNGLWGKERVRVVDEVDMKVGAGEMLGIVGESGSGKTTLARCSLRLLEPSSGSVLFDGQDLASLSAASLRAKRREFQMVFQDPYASLNPLMTIEEIVLEPLKIHRIGTQESRSRQLLELLDAVSLSASLLKRRPGELSGGQQQRVGIARGLAMKPRLLIADEPVSALDASIQAQILNLLGDLKKQHQFTLILISHSLYAIHYLCARIFVMYRGRIVEESSAADFFDAPKHPYSRLLLDSMPTLQALESSRRHSYLGETPSASKTTLGCSFHPRCPQAFDLCRRQIPSLEEIERGRKVACFLFF